MDQTKNRICITGTGRAGTTFLVRLLTLLDLDTGYLKQDIVFNKKYISKNCNSGLEHYNRNNPPLIIKDPTMIEYPEYFILQYNISDVILPIRNYEEAASSREKHGNKDGGLWNAKDKEEQLQVYYKYLSDLLYYASKYDVTIHLLDFVRMTQDPKYLYDRLKFLKTNYSLDTFIQQFTTATEISTK